MEQMIACGLRTVKQQLQFKKLLSHVTEVSAKPEAKPISSHRKLSISAMKVLKPEEKRIYLIK